MTTSISITAIKLFSYSLFRTSSVQIVFCLEEKKETLLLLEKAAHHDRKLH